MTITAYDFSEKSESSLHKRRSLRNCEKGKRYGILDVWWIRRWIQQVTVWICRFVVNTSAYTAAFNCNFDVKKSQRSVGNFPVIFKSRVKGIDGGYKLCDLLSGRRGSANAVVNVTAVKFKFGAVAFTKKWGFVNDDIPLVLKFRRSLRDPYWSLRKGQQIQCKLIF